MSTDKTIPPIQPAPFQRFTVRLVDGHFVRVPKLENITATDATRPPTLLSPGAAREVAKSLGGGAPIPRMLRLVKGHFVRRADLAADRASDEPAPKLPAAARPPGAKEVKPTESWAITFGTRLDPSGSPSEP